MENSIWVSVGVGVIITVIGTILNTLITNKINEGDKRDDEIEKRHKEDIEVVFKRIDQMKEDYVRKDICDQSFRHNSINTDVKVTGVLNVVNAQFVNVENKLSNISDKMAEKSQEIKDLDTKIDHLTELINSTLRKGE